MVKLREERTEDSAAIEFLLDSCFGSDRKSKASYQFRRNAGHIEELSQVAVDDDDAVVGTIRYWPVRLGARNALLLGPIAVDRALHGRGIGRALVFTSLAKADGLGLNTVFLVGDHAYYERFGFAICPPHIIMPGEQPHRLQYRLIGDASLPPDPVLIEPANQRTETTSEFRRAG